MIAGGEKDMWIVRREHNREGPLEAVLQVAGGPAAGSLGPDRDIARLLRAIVIARHISLIAAGVDNIGVIWAHSDIAALAATDLIVVGESNRAEVRAAGQRDSRVILLRAIDAIGRLVIGDHMIKLSGRLIIDRGPAIAAVEGHARAAVVAADHALCIAGIDPEIVIIAVWHRNLDKGLSAIDRLIAALIEYPERLGVLWVSIDMMVVPGAFAQIRILREPFPGSSRVVRTENRAILSLNDSPDAILLRARHGHADLAEQTAGQALMARNIGPGIPAVGRLKEAAALAAALQSMGQASSAPESGVENTRIMGVQRQIVRANLIIEEQNLLPDRKSTRLN